MSLLFLEGVIYDSPSKLAIICEPQGVRFQEARFNHLVQPCKDTHILEIFYLGWIFEGIFKDKKSIKKMKKKGNSEIVLSSIELR